MFQKFLKFIKTIYKSGYPTAHPYVILSNVGIVILMNIYAYLDLEPRHANIVYMVTIIALITYLVVNYIQYKNYISNLKPLIEKYDELDNFYKMQIIFSYVVKIIKYVEDNKYKDLNPILLKNVIKIIVPKYLKLQDEIYRDIYKVKYPDKITKEGLVNTENMTYGEHLIYKQYNHPRKYRRRYYNLEFSDLNQVSSYLKHNITLLLRDMYKELNFLNNYFYGYPKLYPILPKDKDKASSKVYKLLIDTYTEITNDYLPTEINK